jgi:hypothetical protein
VEASTVTAGREDPQTEISEGGRKRQVSSLEQSRSGAEPGAELESNLQTGTANAKCLRAERSADRHGALSAKVGAIQARRKVRDVERGAIQARWQARGIGKGAILDRGEALKC